MPTPYTTYDLEVVTSRTPRQFVEALFERIGVETESDEELAGITEIRTPNFDISAFGGARDALSHELGIEPTVFIEFRPKPTLDTDIIAVKRLLEAIDRWLHFIENDVALIHNGETVMLYRKEGKLRINQACKSWTPARLSLITYPYSDRDIISMSESAKK